MRILLAVLLALGLSACEPRAFKNVDITGGDFARDFQLSDHTGKSRTMADYHGKVVLVFFGFTQCPDVCPTTLTEMKAVKAALGKDGERFQVLFITIDPERDTPQLLSQYVPAFDPAFVGLYGDAEATARTAKEFRTVYEKVPGSDPQRYSMNHTTASYVFDPEGRIRLYVRYGQGVEPLVSDIKLLLDGK